MNNLLLFFVAVILAAIWAVGLFAYNTGNIIHFLLVIAIVIIINAAPMPKRIFNRNKK